MPLLDVRDLRVSIPTPRGAAQILRGVSFSIDRGDTLGIIGESGCGKSMTALAVMGLLPEGAKVEGSIKLEGRELLGLDDSAMQSLRGNRLAMVFQEPMSALNPVHRIGRQIAESLRLHRQMDAAAARAEALRLLERVRMPQAAQRLDAYPHQLSGGQRQRVVIAIALACGPDLLIADEPTTALDASLQREVLDLIGELVREQGMGLMLISHDLGVMSHTVKQLGVMYAGRIVEEGPVDTVFARLAHPYTRGLFAARPRLGMPRGTRLTTIRGRVPELTEVDVGCAFLPRCDWAAPACSLAVPSLRSLGAGGALGGLCGRCRHPPIPPAPSRQREGEPQRRIHSLSRARERAGVRVPARFNRCRNDMNAHPPLLDVRNLGKRYALPRESLFTPPPALQALDDVSFTLVAGKSLGVVGESGSGKSTLARLVMALEAPTVGQVLLDGVDLHALPAPALRAARAKFQMVFQDPFGSLDPRMRVARIVAEPLESLAVSSSAEERRAKAASMLDAVGLRSADLDKFPHQFSGGQRQRIAIARALITQPKLIVADEPVSALDVSVQAQVLNLMQELQERFGLSYLFISHDLAVVDLVCDEILVLQHGKVVERGDPDRLFKDAQHPYTRQLIAASMHV